MSETIIRTIYKPLTDAEKIAIADKIVRLNIDIESMIETKKNLPKQIEGKQEMAAALSHDYETGTESEDVECFCKLDDPEPGKKSFYAIEDNRLVETVDMTESEKAPLFTQEDITEQVEELFNILKNSFQDEKKTHIACHVEQLQELLAGNDFLTIADEPAREIADKLAEEYFDSGVAEKEQKEFLLIEKADYPAFKLKLKALLMQPAENVETVITEDDTVKYVLPEETTNEC
jgi:hypothetical protein